MILHTSLIIRVIRQQNGIGFVGGVFVPAVLDRDKMRRVSRHERDGSFRVVTVELREAITRCAASWMIVSTRCHHIRRCHHNGKQDHPILSTGIGRVHHCVAGSVVHFQREVRSGAKEAAVRGSE